MKQQRDCDAGKQDEAGEDDKHPDETLVVMAVMARMSERYG